MIDGLKPYSKYKDSGVPWLGKVPEHWSIKRLKYLFREVDDRSGTGEEELLSVSHLTGVTPRREKNVTMFLAESNAGHKVCQPDDVVVNTMWAWMAALGVSRHYGLVSPAYGVYRPIRRDALVPTFVDRLFRTETYRSEYLRRSTGVNSSRLRLYPEQFLSIPLLYPPLTEQTAIARVLHQVDHQIAEYIRAKKKLIALLNEQQKSMTDEAVQSGSVRVCRIDQVARIVERPVCRRNDEIYIPIGLFNRGRGLFHKQPTLGAELGDSLFFWLEEGDLILSGQFAWEGAIALASSDDFGCVSSHRYPVLRGKEEVLESAYLLSFFQTSRGQMLLDLHSRGAAGRNRPLNVGSLMKEQIPVPPLSFQQRIAAFAQRERGLQRAAAGTVQLLHEFRTRLISDVVTGKLDVREVSASLSGQEVAGELPEIGDTLEEAEEATEGGGDEVEE